MSKFTATVEVELENPDDNLHDLTMNAAATVAKSAVKRMVDGTFDIQDATIVAIERVDDDEDEQ
ncbi:hypothetical protein HUG10_20980 (plasmid) [Halorarum halophilum]|uniref:Uncharacterized protein n=1 Tax=Halorarum halophilum TaxID=2743090 RepID=A0A7D5KQ36_9EURY|nr:hypothetical protein [Halobaculum halophilum]QLG30062.1 hypothetical protein HUG10_20980 [Halobaculum halophilum]